MTETQVNGVNGANNSDDEVIDVNNAATFSINAYRLFDRIRYNYALSKSFKLSPIPGLWESRVDLVLLFFFLSFDLFTTLNAYKVEMKVL